jgi:Predicted Zn-dependent peptidases
LAFTSIFPQKEIEKEREVILDEIVSYKDLPAEAIYDNFEQLLFKGHPLEMQILGEKKTLNKINSHVFLEYLQTAFSPKNIVFTIVADLPENKVLTMVKKGAEKYFGGEIQLQFVKEGDGFNLFPDKTSPDKTSPSQTSANNSLTVRDLSIGRKFNETIGKKNHQAHCIIGASAYSCMNEKRIPLALLVNIIGGPASNSLLNMVLREKNALVYNVEANYTPYSDTGIFTVYFGCDKADVERCLDLIKKEFSKLVQQELTETALKEG